MAGTAVFADHHAYSGAGLAGVEERARAAGADAIVTTAKDAVRLPRPSLPLLVLRIAAEVDDAALLRERLLRAAERRRSAR